MADFAAEVSKQSGKKVIYNDLPQRSYQAMLESVGQTTKKHGHTSNVSSHFKIISRTYSVPSTVLY
jgi:hypothetical protein